jgi:hypothetical protein
MPVAKKRQFNLASVAQTVRYNDMNIADIKVTDYTDSKYAPSQKYAYINYKLHSSTEFKAQISN